MDLVLTVPCVMWILCSDDGVPALLRSAVGYLRVIRVVSMLVALLLLGARILRLTSFVISDVNWCTYPQIAG